MVSRIYVEKKEKFAVKTKALFEELRDVLGIEALTGVRLINRYDVEGIAPDLFDACIPTVFSEPQVDDASREMPAVAQGATIFAVEYLPGQFDVRANSASECIQLISQGERPLVRSATVYVLEGELTPEDVARIKRYVINPVEAREAALELPVTLVIAQPEPEPVEILDGFLDLDEAGLKAFVAERGLAMDTADIKFCQDYFHSEGRVPTITEIRVMDTYWSDHCRHTTFGTVLEDVSFDDPRAEAEYNEYLNMRKELGREDKPITLMDIATMGARVLKARGILKNLDESEEINACTVKVKVDVDGEEEDWLYLFKNETHNHPTEIEPFGGAATCIGGAIRDPLSGRSYVYQAMRITGAADPTVPVSETIPGKLPQRKLCVTAAEGYSSYGNQIGLATGQVAEVYHPGYMAKRLEIGAVVGATPARHVRRETPAPGDVIVLLGGRTGRDGIGGATGSSKAHSEESLTTCGAEVQKGNPITERKLQRLFRREDACTLIKRCNDFGAGGVSVAIGELADGLLVNLDAVPKKYEGLDGTELAISESQERMAVALAPEDVEKFIALAEEENLEATPVATVTAEPRLRMTWRGDTIVDVSRDFLASNGAPKSARAHVAEPGVYERDWEGEKFWQKLDNLLHDINVASNKGLAERFDSTIGAGTVLMPYGGMTQLTPTMAMVAKLPVLGETTTVSGMSWGFNPYLMEADPFSGAYIAVVESVCKLICAGFKREDAYLTFQEYFERLRDEPTRWGKPVAALLGALKAQVDLGIASVGGKDSMSGSFEDLDVPPTLVSFATAVGKIDRVRSPEFKKGANPIIVLIPEYEEDGITPKAASLLSEFEFVDKLIESGAALSLATPGYGGLAECVFKCIAGNHIGMKIHYNFREDALFAPAYGAFVIELDRKAELPDHLPEGVVCAELGKTMNENSLDACVDFIHLPDVQREWELAFDSVYPYFKRTNKFKREVWRLNEQGVENGVVGHHHVAGERVASPRVIIPVFPGTNCEYDTVRAFERAGAKAETLIINNLTPERVAESAEALVKAIDNSQIIMIPGGFSGGDEPDGSAKFIASFFRAPAVTEAVRRLLFERDGLMLGICNGFQALVKLGLLPYGDIREVDENCPTLTFNTIGRHQSRIARTRVMSDLSPWLMKCRVPNIYNVPISHGEGRFVAPDELVVEMFKKGQIATQYCTVNGDPFNWLSVNPNGSDFNIEGISSPDGRILGKMGHSERWSEGLYKNVPEPGRPYQPIFEGGVAYFKD